jgi:hypothetical protein
VINLTKERPLRRAVPVDFPYLSAEWNDGLAEDEKQSSLKNSSVGVVHPVDNSSELHVDYCLDVLTGLLDVEPLRMRRGVSRHGHTERGEQERVEEVERKKVERFQKIWAMYDWTGYCM